MIDLLPAAPDPAVDTPTVFSQKAAAMVLAQKAMVPQINAALASMNVLQTGGAYALVYTNVNVGSIGSPEGGKVCLNDGTFLTLDKKDATGRNVSALLNTFGASTSDIKGTLRLVKLGDPTKWMIYNITSYDNGIDGDYGVAGLSYIVGSDGGAIPLQIGDDLALFFQRTGDRGTDGATALLASATIGSPVANIDFLSIFTADYDRYTIDVQGLNASAAGNALAMRLANGGVVDSAIAYTSPGLTTMGGVSLNSTQVSFGDIAQAAAGSTLTIDVRNANSIGIKAISHRGGYLNSSGTYTITTAETLYIRALAASGFRLYWNLGANFTAGTVRVYGHLNA